MSGLVEPTLTIHDIGGPDPTTITASPAAARLLRDEAQENYEKALAALTAIGGRPSFSWEEIQEILLLLGGCSQAAKVIRATTPTPEADTDSQGG